MNIQNNLDIDLMSNPIEGSSLRMGIISECLEKYRNAQSDAERHAVIRQMDIMWQITLTHRGFQDIIKTLQTTSK